MGTDVAHQSTIAYGNRILPYLDVHEHDDEKGKQDCKDTSQNA